MALCRPFSRKIVYLALLILSSDSGNSTPGVQKRPTDWTNREDGGAAWEDALHPGAEDPAASDRRVAVGSPVRVRTREKTTTGNDGARQREKEEEARRAPGIFRC